MAIPINTTTVTVIRPVDAGNTDPYEETPPTEWVTIATGVRAALGLTSGTGSQNGSSLPGDTEQTGYQFVSDPVDLQYQDRIIDDYDGRTYEVVYAVTSPALAGLSNTQAGLNYVQGFTP